MRRFVLFTVVALLALTEACAVGPRYRRSSLGLPDGWRRPAVSEDSLRSFYDSLRTSRDTLLPAGADTARVPFAYDTASPAPRMDSTAALRWLDLIQDSVLRQLVDTSLRANRDMRTALAVIDEFRAQYRATRGALLPELTANGQAGRNQTVFGTFGSFTYNAERAAGAPPRRDRAGPRAHRGGGAHPGAGRRAVRAARHPPGRAGRRSDAPRRHGPDRRRAGRLPADLHDHRAVRHAEHRILPVFRVRDQHLAGVRRGLDPAFNGRPAGGGRAGQHRAGARVAGAVPLRADGARGAARSGGRARGTAHGPGSDRGAGAPGDRAAPGARARGHALSERGVELSRCAGRAARPLRRRAGAHPGGAGPARRRGAAVSRRGSRVARRQGVSHNEAVRKRGRTGKRRPAAG